MTIVFLHFMTTNITITQITLSQDIAIANLTTFQLVLPFTLELEFKFQKQRNNTKAFIKHPAK